MEKFRTWYGKKTLALQFYTEKSNDFEAYNFKEILNGKTFGLSEDILQTEKLRL